MAQLFRFHRMSLAISILFWSGVSSALATFVEIKDPNDTQASDINFGVIRGSSPYHTSTQYLEVTHTGASYRKIYIYTDNNAAFGISDPGLVSQEGWKAIPMVFQNYLSKPPENSVLFSASNANDWSAVLDQSNPDFASLKETSALIVPGPGNMSFVYLGIQVPLGEQVNGAYNTNIVFEDWSDAEEVDGPIVAHNSPQSLIVVPNESVGFLLTMEEYSGLETYGVRYRIEGDAQPYEESAGTTPQQEGSIYTGSVELDPSFRLLPGGVLEYYFVAKDIYINVTETLPIRMNLVSHRGTASIDYKAAGGTVNVAVGDPRHPGVQVTFPAGSLRSDGTLTVALKESASYPAVGGSLAARVVQVGPDDPGLLRPATLSIPYLDRDDDGKEDTIGAEESGLRLYWHDGFAWRYVGGQVDPNGNTVRVSVSRFGVYGVFPNGGLTADTVRPLERILTPSQGNNALIFNTSVDAGPFDIEIFDVRGSVVRTLHNVNVWDGRDDSGNRVESGTYVYRFEGQGITLSGMIAVVR